jgi:nucleoside-triphosphatase THEP1
LKVYIITGGVDSGKSTLANNLVNELLIKNVKVYGVIAKGIREPINNQKTGHSVLLISSGEGDILDSIYEPPELSLVEKFGRFYFYKEVFNKALKEIEKSDEDSVLFIDEIGMIELNGFGYCQALYNALDRKQRELYLVVRESLIDKVCEKFKIFEYELIKV